MPNIQIIEASISDAADLAALVKSLLLELEPSATEEIERMQLDQVASTLLSKSSIWALLAKHEGQTVGGITLHQCAAIYAGGVFGEISELYVEPEYRSSQIGERLLSAAIAKGRTLGWTRLEVGSPPESESPRTVKFYQGQGFKCTGPRFRYLID